MREIDVWLSEFEIEPETIEVRAGERIRFKVHNGGLLVHDLVSDGTDLAVYEVQSRETRTVEVEFEEPGVYETVCHLGHQERKMLGMLVVRQSQPLRSTYGLLQGFLTLAFPKGIRRNQTHPPS